MNKFLRLFALAMTFASRAVAAQTAGADCQSTAPGAYPGAYKGYVILDQSPRSDAFLKVLRTLARPDLVAINRIKGDYSRIKISAERHPAAYIITEAGTALQVNNPADFVRRMNALAPCPPGAAMVAGARR